VSLVERGQVEKYSSDTSYRSAQSLLKQDYKDDISLEDAKALALKIMSKTMDSTKLGSEKCEFLLPLQSLPAIF
jgi:hypothetical protein